MAVGGSDRVPGQLDALPAQHLVGESLERLAEHDETTLRAESPMRVPSAEVDVAQPTTASTVASLDGQNDQVEGVDRLDLDPADPAAPHVVCRVVGLDHDSFVPSCDRVDGEGCCRIDLLGIGDVGHVVSGCQLGRGYSTLERSATNATRLVDEIGPIQVQD